MQVKPDSYAVTEKYLNVGVTVSHGDWIRFAVVKIPLDDLMASPLVERFDSIARRRLIEAWSGVDMCDPLF